MIESIQKKENEYCFIIDIALFNENVITKALYWYIESFSVFWNKRSENIHEITLKVMPDAKNKYTFEYITNKFNQDLIDYKNRDLIIKETKDIRNILYVKAFANNDDFEDFNLAPEE